MCQPCCVTPCLNANTARSAGASTRHVTLCELPTMMGIMFFASQRHSGSMVLYRSFWRRLSWEGLATFESKFLFRVVPRATARFRFLIKDNTAWVGLKGELVGATGLRGGVVDVTDAATGVRWSGFRGEVYGGEKCGRRDAPAHHGRVARVNCGDWGSDAGEASLPRSGWRQVSRRWCGASGRR